MKTSTKLLLLLTFLFFFLKSNSQIGPNLAAGAGGLAFSQGQLDAQVILDIIATKKEELKAELGKRLILDKLKGCPYALYNYTEKNLNLLFGEGNKEVVTKEFMENSAELLLVYGLAEYLLQDMKAKRQLSLSESNIAELFNRYVDTSFVDTLSRLFPRRFDYYYATQQYRRIYKREWHLTNPKDSVNQLMILIDTLNKYNLKKIKEIQDQDSKENSAGLMFSSSTKSIFKQSSQYLLKPEITTLLTNKSNDSYQETKGDNYPPISMLVDLIYDVCINNDNVKSTGMFQSNHTNIDRYKALSKYWYFEKNNDSIFIALAGYHSRVDSIVTYLFGYYNLFKEYKNLYDDKGKPELNKLIKSVSYLSKNVGSEFAKLKEQILATGNQKNPTLLPETYKEIESINDAILGLNKYIPTIDLGRIGLAKWNLDQAYSIQKNIISRLSSINIILGGVYDKALITCDSLHEELFKNALYLFGKDSTIIYKLIGKVQNYLPLLDIINNLDRVESYDYMFKFLTGITETIGDNRTKAVVQALTSGVDKYTTIDKDANKINIDVEGLAVNLYSRFSKNQRTRISLLFTVGANHNTALGNNFHFVVNDTLTKPYSQFIAEKIGFRINLIDWNRRRSFNLGLNKLSESSGKQSTRIASRAGRDPLVNNLHLMAYGSGLLYQIKALNSADNFTEPILGAGLGLSFFNGLEFNATYATLYSDFNKGFLCLSFDIAFTEYLTGLKNKKQ
jgi:hypothetical protein